MLEAKSVYQPAVPPCRDGGEVQCSVATSRREGPRRGSEPPKLAIACCEIRAAGILIARILLSTVLSEVPDGGVSHARVQLYSEVGAKWVSIGT